MLKIQIHIIYLFIFNTSLIILTPFIKGPVHNYLAFTLIFLGTNLLILSFVWQAIKQEKFEIIISPLQVVSFLFLGAILFSYIFTINPPSTRYGFFTMASVIINGLFLSFVKPSGLHTKGNENVAQTFRFDSLKAKALSYKNPAGVFLEQRLWKGLCFVLVLTISALSLMALYQYITGHSDFEGRAHAAFVTPNSFAGYLLLTMPILMGLYLSPTPVAQASSLWRQARCLSHQRGQGEGCFLSKYIFFFLSLLSFAALLSTGTGGRWIILTAAIAAALILFRIFAPYAGKRLMFLAIGFLAVLLIFLAPTGKNAASFSPNPATISGSTADRLNIWKSTWGVIKEHPIRGVGFWSFHTIYTKYKNQIYKGVEHYFSHNDYLQLWAELGLIGVIIFFVLILVYFREGFRCLKILPSPSPSPQPSPVKREGARIMLLSTLIGSFLVLIHTISDFDLYIPAILFIFWGYIAYAASTASELGLCKTKVVDLSQFRIFTALGKKKLYIITAGIFAFLCFWVSDPYIAGLHNARGRVYLGRGEYEKAVKYFSKAVELDSIDDSYHFNLGLALLAKYSSDPLILKRAEEEMKKAMSLSPYRSDIYFNMAIIYRSFYLKEKGDVAIEMLKKAREFEPVDITITYNLGTLYLEMKQYKNAADEFRKYLEEKPDDNYAHFLMANILVEMKRYDEADKEYRLALREKGKEGDVWYAIGLLSLKQNKPKEAELAFKKAIGYNKKDDSGAVNGRD